MPASRAGNPEQATASAATEPASAAEQSARHLHLATSRRPQGQGQAGTWPAEQGWLRAATGPAKATRKQSGWQMPRAEGACASQPEIVSESMRGHVMCPPMSEGNGKR